MPCNERICFSASLSAGRPAFGCRRYSEENPSCDLKFLSSAKAYRPTPHQRQFMPSSVCFRKASGVECRVFERLRPCFHGLQAEPPGSTALRPDEVRSNNPRDKKSGRAIPQRYGFVGPSAEYIQKLHLQGPD